MPSAQAAVCVVSPDPDKQQDIKNIVDEIGTYPCLVASSSKQLSEAKQNQQIRLLLLDRALATEELAQFPTLEDDCRLATFGIAKSASVALDSLESVASYQLRQAIARRDLETLFAYLDRTKTTKPREKKRCSHLYRGLVGDSPAITKVRDLIAKVSQSKSTVLITGETGTGKEIVARNIHYQSGQGSAPFVPVNCSAIPPDLLESELFGHRKGAFTGALSDREGRFAAATGGTLFLDEIGDMTLSLQAKLLRVLEERVMYRVGCNKPIEMTARVVAATHRDLETCIKEGKFREDLFYRLNVVPITVPPLRERTADIPLLVHELSCRLQREQGITISMTPECIRELQSCNWAGNVRELANLVERLGVFSPNGIADVKDLPEQYKNRESFTGSDVYVGLRVAEHEQMPQILTEDGLDLKEFLRSTETELIRQALECSGGTISQAANLLNIGRTTLSEKVKRLGLTDFVMGTNL
ncbi:MAG: sigma-54 dependent transcriptional regulator [Gammaproteobacteria bacterium]|nr:sigma-54 dependent transcriptional regulator [Gammaproteobacteria bacterium]